MTRKAKQRRRQDPRDTCSAMERGLNAALERLSNETTRDRQKVFARMGRGLRRR
jgi:hypothetical protein